MRVLEQTVACTQTHPRAVDTRDRKHEGLPWFQPRGHIHETPHALNHVIVREDMGRCAL